MPIFDIIIITHNARRKLECCIDSVQKYTKGYGLTVVDNNSGDGTRRYLDSLRSSREIKIILSRKNLGFCAAANLALRKTSRRFVVLLDDDVEVTKEWLSKLYQQMKARSRVGIVGCRIVSPEVLTMGAEFRLKPFGLVGNGEIDKGQRTYVREVDALSGPCWLIRRELLGKVGYFDERFYPCQFEDIDYCLRVRSAGYKIIYTGQAKVIHHHLARTGDLYRKNERRFFSKWGRSLDVVPFRDSHPADKYMAKGQGFLEQKEYQKALVQFKRVGMLDRRFAVPFYEGLALSGMGRGKEAIRKFRKVLARNPLKLSAKFMIGQLLRDGGEPEHAAREFKDILRIAPSNLLARYHLSLVCRKVDPQKTRFRGFL